MLLLGGHGINSCASPSYRARNSHQWEHEKPLPQEFQHGQTLAVSCWEERFAGIGGFSPQINKVSLAVAATMANEQQADPPVALPLTNSWQSYGGSYGSATHAVTGSMCSVKGLTKSGGWGSLATLPEKCRPNRRLIFRINNHQTSARADVQATGAISWHDGGKSHAWISLSGIVFEAGANSQKVLPLTNTWKSYGGGYGSATYAVTGGMCSVKGLIRGGGWGSLATLPSSGSLNKRLIFSSNNHQTSARVDVQTKGAISWHAGGKSHSGISLSGIVFATGTNGQKVLPLTDTWKSYGGSYGSATYAVTGGVCSVNGLIKGSSWRSLATLPSDGRPSKKLLCNRAPSCNAGAVRSGPRRE
jgi:hypothetical protein